jgi:hypothetical protein
MIDIAGIRKPSADVIGGLFISSRATEEDTPHPLVEIVVEHPFKPTGQVLGPTVVVCVHQERIGQPPEPSVCFRTCAARKFLVLRPEVLGEQSLYVFQSAPEGIRHGLESKLEV